MKRKLAAVLLALVMMFASLPVSATGAEPVEISDYDDLLRFAAMVNGTEYDGVTYTADPSINAILTADITADAFNREWTVISSDAANAYTGVFDGKGHKIEGLSNADVSPKPQCAGLFGYIGAAGTVKNLCIEDADMTAVNPNGGDNNVFAGVVAGYNEGTLYNLQIKQLVNVSVTSDKSSMSGNYNFYAGGIAAYNKGAINNCSISGNYSIASVSNNNTVQNTSYAGALAGYNDGTVTNCISSGSGRIEASSKNDSYAGGLIGYNDTDAAVQKCENRGSAEVNAEIKNADHTAAAGGIAGYNNGSISGTCCTGSGSIKAHPVNIDRSSMYYAGGFAGWNGSSGSIQSSFCSGSPSVSEYDIRNLGYAGGFAGYNQGTIGSCYSTGGSIQASLSSGGSAYSGGFAGGNDSGADIQNCYVWGKADITAATCAGGLLGYNRGVLQNAYTCASGALAASTVGAVAGKNEGTVTRCYFDNDLIGGIAAIGDGEGTNISGLTTEQMIGHDAISSANMNFTNWSDVWLDGLEYEYQGLVLSCYPHLKGFAYDTTQELSDWTPLGICRIGSYGQLKAFAGIVNSGNGFISAYLTDDITASDTDWIPIGADASHAFTGVFDGCGHTIMGLGCTVDKTETVSSVYAGLFGYLGSDGVVKNVGLKNTSITAKGIRSIFAGAIAGYSKGLIKQCYISGTGKVEVYGTIQLPSSVYGYSGGLVGNNAGTVQDCYSFGQTDVTADMALELEFFRHMSEISTYSGTDAAYAGGLVGFSSGAVKTSYSANKGRIFSTPSDILTDVYEDYKKIQVNRAFGSYAGAIAGGVSDGCDPVNCYYDRWISASDQAVGNDTAAGGALTTEQMTKGTLADDNGTYYVENMPGLLSENWLVHENETGYYFYPQLKGFAFDTTQVISDWPAKLTDIAEPQSQQGGAANTRTFTLTLDVSGYELADTPGGSITATITEKTLRISGIPAGTNVRLHAWGSAHTDTNVLPVWELAEYDLSMDNPIVCPLEDDSAVKLRILHGDKFVFVRYHLDYGNLSKTLLAKVELQTDDMSGITPHLAAPEKLYIDQYHECFRRYWECEWFSNPFESSSKTSSTYEGACSALYEWGEYYGGDLWADVYYKSDLYCHFSDSFAGTITYEETDDGNAVFTAQIREGYSFVRWDYYTHDVWYEVAETTTANPWIIPLSERGSGTYTAVVSGTKYQLSVQAGNDAMGSVTGGDWESPYHYEKVTATPNEGYRFKEWTWTGAGDDLEFDTGNKYTAEAWIRMPVGDLSMTAVFEPVPGVPHTVTVVNGTGDSEHYAGWPVTVTADSPAEGMQFKEWTGADGLSITSGSRYTSEITITMPDKAVTLTATYEPIYFNTYYIDANGTRHNVRARRVNGETTSLTENWYAVERDLTILTRMFVNGPVNLILCDGAELISKQGITVGSGDNDVFSIYAQSDDIDVAGGLTVTRQSPYYDMFAAGIGGDRYVDFNEIIINGGYVTAYGGSQGAGIGGRYNSEAGCVTINGGYVYAYGGYGCTGIGGGMNGHLTSVTLNGGDIYAIGDRAPGIGSGFEALAIVNQSMSVIITDGVRSICATGTRGADNIGRIYSERLPRLTFDFPVTVEFRSGGSIVSGSAKDAVFCDYEANGSRYIYPKSHYGIKVTSGGHGTIAQSRIIADPGDLVTIEAFPDDGYRLKEWSGASGLVFAAGDANGPMVTFLMPHSNVTLTAVFELAQNHTLAVNGGTGGGEYTEATVVTVTADAPEAGKRFKTWSGTDGLLFISGGASDAEFVFYMPNSNVTLTAVYETIPSHSVSVTGGTGSGSYPEGSAVTITAAPPTGKRIKQWTGIDGLTFTSGSSESAAVTFTMPERDLNITAVFEDIPDDPVYATESLTLNGQIGVNFYMDLDALTEQEKQDSYLTFSISGKGTVPSDPVSFDPNNMNSRGTFFGFTCLTNAIQMADTITATCHYGNDQEVSATYSVKQYIETFEQLKDRYNDIIVNLVHSLADYGHYVQLYLQEVRGWEFGTDYARMTTYYHTADYDVDPVRTAISKKGIVRQNDTNGDIEGITYSLVMDSETAIRVYFRPTDGYSGAFTVTGDAPAAVKQSDGRYLVEIKGIRIQDLDKTYKFDVATENGTAHVEVSALSYVKGILDLDGASLNAKNAVCSLYWYYRAAQSYLAMYPN